MEYRNDVVYVNDVAFPFTPVHDIGLYDVDLDPYTNTEGYTKRNRVRKNTTTLPFKIEVLEGKQINDLIKLKDDEYFNCTFWSDEVWDMVTKKMYCATLKYTQDYIDPYNPDKNIYKNIEFEFVEQ